MLIDTISIAFPFPPSALMPRKSDGRHFAVTKPVKDQYHLLCRNATLLALGNRRFMASEIVVPMAMVFWPPDRRMRDADNLERAFKTGRDAMAQALGFNDGVINPTLKFIMPYRQMYPTGRLVIHLGRQAFDFIGLSTAGFVNYYKESLEIDRPKKPRKKVTTQP